MPDSWLKGCEFEPWQKRRENFLLQSQLCVLTLIGCLFQPSVTAVAQKRPRSFCQNCWWQVTPKHAYTLDPSKLEWADYAAVQAECGNLSGNELTRNSSGNTWSQSSQLAEPLWTDPGLQSGISFFARADLHFKKKKKHRQGMNCQTFSQNPCTQGQKPPPPLVLLESCGKKNKQLYIINNHFKVHTHCSSSWNKTIISHSMAS